VQLFHFSSFLVVKSKISQEVMPSTLRAYKYLNEVYTGWIWWNLVDNNELLPRHKSGGLTTRRNGLKLQKRRESV